MIYGYNPHAIVAALSALIVLLLVVRAFRRWTADDKDPFDVRDLFMENGRASKGAVVLMGAFFATTLHFLYYTLTDRMTEAYFTLYAGAWITPVVTKLIVTGGKPTTPQEASP